MTSFFVKQFFTRIVSLEACMIWTHCFIGFPSLVSHSSQARSRFAEFKFCIIKLIEFSVHSLVDVLGLLGEIMIVIIL